MDLKTADWLFLGGLLITISPLILLSLSYLLKIIGGCSGDYQVTSSSTISCEWVPFFKSIIEFLIGFGFIASFTAGVGLFLLVPSIIVKMSLMIKRKRTGQKFINSRLDIIFLISSILFIVAPIGFLVMILLGSYFL